MFFLSDGIEKNFFVKMLRLGFSSSCVLEFFFFLNFWIEICLKRFLLNVIVECC